MSGVSRKFDFTLEMLLVDDLKTTKIKNYMDINRRDRVPGKFEYLRIFITRKNG